MTPECHISDPEHYNNIVESMAFSHDSARLLSASRVGTVHIWDADSGDCEAILDIGRVKSRISFDRTGYFLHTGRGMIAIDAIPRPHIARGEIDHRNLQFQGVGLSSDQQWITCNSQKLLWLPYEYRPSNYTVSGRTIGFGVGSGKVWMCKLGISIFEHP
jgi:WD40 repeat protein